MIGDYDSGDFAGEIEEDRQDRENWFYLKRDMDDGISPWSFRNDDDGGEE
jgi:hypothetical protein